MLFDGILSNLLMINLLIIFLVFPVILFAINVINIFNNEKKNRFFEKLYINRKIWTIISFVLGIVLTVIALAYISEYSWNEPIIRGSMSVQMHEPFSSKYMLSLAIFAVVALVSAIILDNVKLLPPLVAVICTSGIYGGIIFWGFYSAQLFKNLINPEADGILKIIIPYLLLYVANYFVCSIRIIRETIIFYTQYYEDNNISSRFKFVEKIQKILKESTGWIWFPLICIIPLTGVLLCICFILGQGVSGIIKAFIETSDWTFSTMISPPPVEYQGHYLCTVAVNGHEKIVKPTRSGIRQGVKIGVNRQLCVANAFEQLIEEKAPRFHKTVRYIYDKYGYPISKHITTKLRADIIYMLMKPLEWIFIFTLYLFDINPENRISLQYTGKKLKDFE